MFAAVCVIFNAEQSRFCTGLDAALTSITPWLRIPLLTVRDIMKVVKPSGIVASEQWLEALDYLAAPTDGDRPCLPALRAT